ncbi:MAG: hypothetical protein CMF40_05560 [Legionellales bacterium]|nr:hypothetical protein [Legionellales bacterium]
MVTRTKKNKTLSCPTCTLLSNEKDSPKFDLSHLEHHSLKGFIKHPESFFLKSRYMSFFSEIAPDKKETSGLLGFSFSSKSYRVTGSIIEVSLNTVNETHQILGKVIVSIQTPMGYEIGMLLMNAEDYRKISYIEQICYIDNQLISSII